MEGHYTMPLTKGPSSGEWTVDKGLVVDVDGDWTT
jgi:hypothetical protein